MNAAQLHHRVRCRQSLWQKTEGFPLYTTHTHVHTFYYTQHTLYTTHILKKIYVKHSWLLKTAVSLLGSCIFFMSVFHNLREGSPLRDHNIYKKNKLTFVAPDFNSIFLRFCCKILSSLSFFGHFKNTSNKIISSEFKPNTKQKKKRNHQLFFWVMQNIFFRR